MPARKKPKALNGIKLLLVEDDDFLSDILDAKLSDDGGLLTVCTSGVEALRLMEQDAPDIVITDLMLPGMSGEEFVEKIRQHKKYNTTPIVVFSNKSDQKNIDALLANGVAEYHIKSQTSLKDIPKIIQRVLNVK